MSDDRFRALIDAICKHAKLGDPRAMYESAYMKVKETNFTISPGGAMHPGRALVYADFGELPSRQRQQILLRLLASNHATGEELDAPIFCFNPENQRVVLVLGVPLEITDIDALFKVFEKFAEIAGEWRSTYFLNNDAIGSARAGMSGISGNAAQLRLRQSIPGR